MARRRGLEEVFHFFISEEEQREIRARSGSDAPVVRWCIAANPTRPLSGALVRDLAVVLARLGRPVHVFAPFEATFEAGAGVMWNSGKGPLQLYRALREVPPDSSLLAIESATQIARWIEELRHDDITQIDALILPIEAAEWGIVEAHASITELAAAAQSLRVAGVVLSAIDAKFAHALFGRVAGWAHSEFGLELELAGSLDRDGASFRSLLQGIPLTEIDPTAASAQSLERLIEGLIPATRSRDNRTAGAPEPD